MTNKLPESLAGKAIAGVALGSTAVAAALLYSSRRKEKKLPPPVVPSGEPPETD